MTMVDDMAVPVPITLMTAPPISLKLILFLSLHGIQFKSGTIPYCVYISACVHVNHSLFSLAENDVLISSTANPFALFDLLDALRLVFLLL